jgi:hypothetical protein
MTPVNVFSVLSLTTWAAILVWSLRQRKERWFHVWVLLLATLAWWLGECVAIRLGKYEYAQFPALLVFPLGGTPTDSDWLASSLAQIHAWLKLPKVAGCMPAQASWNIPVPIVALEASLVFVFLRLSFFRLWNKGAAAACAAGCFSAVLMVTLAGILDPVVSTTQWCGAPESNPFREGLHNVALWHWFTNETYTGYWFGVPMVNYMSWFVGMWAFSFMSRLDDEGPGGIIRHYDRWYKYVGATALTLLIVFILELPLKIAVDLILVRSRHVLFGDHLFPSKGVWEFAVIGVLLVLNLLVIWRSGQIHPKPRKVGWLMVGPPLAVLTFCLVYLLLEPRAELFVVLSLSAVMMAIVIFVLPAMARRRAMAAAPPLPVEGFRV